MILKEKCIGEELPAAVVLAEREVAFYLRRFFAEDDEVYVLGDIRLQLGEDMLELDHVLIHQGGITIIDSLSLAGQLELLPDGRCLLWRGDVATRVANPQTLAASRISRLRNYLQGLAWQPGMIDGLNIDSLLVRTGEGEAGLPKEPGFAEACHVDMLCKRIRARAPLGVSFLPLHRKVLGEYLIRVHQTSRDASRHMAY